MSAGGPGLTESRDLRGGQPCWVAEEELAVAADPLPDRRVDVAIVGAGVMGAMLAERLSALGLGVLLLDRRPPAHGSTAASTALVMWGADVPLSMLGARIGADAAARRWRRVRQASNGLAARIDAEGIPCARIDRPELYLAGGLLDEAGLQAEAEVRKAAGLPSVWLDAGEVGRRFGIAPRAALLSDGSYEVDPVRLTLGMLALARGNGARACFPVDVVALQAGDDCIRLELADGARVEAAQAILASGYERPPLFLPPAFGLSSSYAVATAPGTAPLWRGDAMIWEASSPYLYARATADGRVIAGGEDEDFDDARRRDALIGAKRGRLAARLAAMAGVADVAVDCAWAASFGTSPDGLPAIGRAANHERLWLAAGFGGNGVTFAALGAELLAAEFRGRPDPDAACFDPYRFNA